MIAALLSWFDEDPDWLTTTVQSLAILGAERLIAIDGAYGQFPDAVPRSAPEQHAAIAAAATMDFTLYAPDRVWPTEMAKRSRLFELGEQVTTPDDWYFVIDADEQVLEAPNDLEAQLEGHVAGEAVYAEPRPDGKEVRFPRRCLFKATRGLSVGHNHFTYTQPDGPNLWGRHPLVLAKRVEGLLCDHRSLMRPQHRRTRAKAYYDARDESLVEVGPCVVCGFQGVEEIPTGWHRIDTPDEPTWRLGSQWVSACNEHLVEVKNRNRQTLGQWLPAYTVEQIVEHGMHIELERCVA